MKRNLLYLLVLAANGLYAQDVLTLDKAIELSLKTNSVEIAKKNVELAQNNNTLGNAGYLPRVGLNGAYTYTNTNLTQRLSNGTNIERNAVGGSNINGGLTVSWTVFNGLRAQYTHKQLGEQENLSELQLKTNINNSVANVMAAYFTVLREQQSYANIQDNIDVYEERAKIANTRYTIGSAAKTDLLQAKVDLNEQKALLLRQDAVVRSAKANLNQLLNRDATIDFTVETISPSLDSLNYDSVRTAIERENIDLKAIQKNIDIARFGIKQAETLLYPTLGFTSGYNFNRTSSQAGFTLYNQNYGLNVGLSLSWNIYDGLNTRRQIKNARIAVAINELTLKDQKNTINSGLTQAWYNYTSARQQYKLEGETKLLAQENVDIMLERFRLGNCTTIDLKLAQQTLQDSQVRFIQAGYAVKVAETELLRLNNRLVK